MKGGLEWCGVAFLVCLLSGCGLCSDTVVSEVTSPDGAMTATWFVRNCGATTEFSSIVSVHRKSEGFRNERDIVFVVAFRPQLSLTWTGRRTLSVECEGCLRANVFRKVTALGSIDIVYPQGSTSSLTR